MLRVLSLLCLLRAATPFSSKQNNGVRVVSSLSAQKEATFGMGCFWKPAEELLKTDGVIDTVAGYTGNPQAREAPTYDNVCFGRSWVEGVRVYYDDTKVSYQQLLDAFFDAQEPKLGSRQYASIIFPHDSEQQLDANTWLEANSMKMRDDGVTVAQTEVEPLSPFYQAEGYHQRYWQKQRPRFAAIIVLIAISMGAIDSVFPTDLASTVHTAGNTGALVLALYQLLERQIDAKVVEL